MTESAPNIFEPLSATETTVNGIAAGKDKKPEKTPIIPVPADAPAMNFKHPKHGLPAQVWSYRNENSELVFYIGRFDCLDKDGQPAKDYLPITFCDLGNGKRGWRGKGTSKPRLLYNLPNLKARPDADVIVCEGEKAADAAAALFPDYVVITSPNGAKAADNADWSFLVGRRVAIWPDHDSEGLAYAADVSRLALAAGAESVAVVRVPDGFPPKWDLADALPDSVTQDDLCRLLADAVTDVTPVQANDNEGLDVTEGVTADQDGVTPNAAIPSQNKRPCFLVFDDWVGAGKNKHRPGVWYFGIKEKGGEIELTQQWICSPAHIDAVTFDGQQNNFGRLLRFLNTNKRWREWAMPMELLRGAGDELRGELLAMGVEIDPLAKTLLAQYLQSQHPKKRVRCALQVGLCDGSFVLPDVVIGPKASDVIFQSGERGNDEHTQSGTLESWKTDIASLANGNPLLTLAISGAFAGPVLALCHAESGGIHLVGDSSTGKTTAVDAACSVWGGPNFKRSWRATANGMEGAAALFNDCLFAPDEISECDPREVGAIVYALGNGCGKQRASRTGRARSVTRWRCFVLSSGERTIGTTMAEGGYRIKAGQSMRLLDVPAARTFGSWDDLHGAEHGAAFSDVLKQAVAKHHGTAGRAFLERLTRDERKFCEFLERIKDLPQFSVMGGEGQDKRAAARFALIALAGEIATEYGLTDWKEGAAIDAAAIGFKAWRSTRSGSGNDERRQILERVSAFIERHGDGRFSNATGITTEGIIRDRAGWWRDEGDDRRTYLFNKDGLHEALKGFDFKRALDVLQEAGALSAPSTSGERSKPFRISGRLTRLYPIAVDKLGMGDGT